MPSEILTYREARREDLDVLVDLLANDLLGAQRENVSQPIHPHYVSACQSN